MFPLRTVVFAILAALVCAAHDHHHDQMPLDYVKYPYQAIYPGDGEGIYPHILAYTPSHW